MKFLVLFILSVFSFQNTAYKHHEDFSFFKTDNLKNLYLVSGEIISMVDETGKQIFDYNNLKLGNISSVDQTSSLRTMVFYKDQSTFLVLDNTLAIQTPKVRLNQFGLNYITLMCASENNHYWCYDAENNSIRRINQQIKEVSNGVDLNQLLSQVVDPIEIIERHGKVYLNDPENGVHVFDTYGNYEKTVDIKNAEDIEVDNNDLYFLKNNTISKMDLQLILTKNIVESEENISGFNIQIDKVLYQVGRLIKSKSIL